MVDLGWHVSMTKNHHHAICAPQRAMDGLVDPLTGEIRPIAVVSDNGPAFRADGFARFIASRPKLIHIRTRRRGARQNGVRERACGSLRYGHLYRFEIPDAPTLQAEAEVEAYRHIFDCIPTARGDRDATTDGPVPSAPAGPCRGTLTK